MGKYMNKSKVSSEVAVMGVGPQSSLGVRTRARALADPAFAYLELRSRRLEKTAPVAAPGKQRVRANVESESVSENEVSMGHNFVDSQVIERYVRETTPCSLIRDPETIGTPGSATRPANSSSGSRRTSNLTQRNIPSSHEMDNFFAGAEQIQQQIFMEKYNFDPVNDHPLPGRYEWVQLNF